MELHLLLITKKVQNSNIVKLIALQKKLLLLLIIPFYTTAKGALFTVINTANAGPGSFRQAIINVNASTAAADTIRFNIPLTASGYNALTGVFTITIATSLPELRKSQVLIDGYSQRIFTGNTNTATFRSRTTAGLGIDGLEGTADDPVFPAIPGAEIQFNVTGGAAKEFIIVGDSNILRGLAFVNLRLTLKGNSEGLVEACTFGIYAHNFADPGAANRITNAGTFDEGSLELFDTTVNLTIRNNLFAYAHQRGLFIIDANWNYNLQVLENEFAFTNRQNNFAGGAIEFVPILILSPNIDSTSTIYKVRKAIIARNLIHDSKATDPTKTEFGIEINLKESTYSGFPTVTHSRLDSILIENNSIYENNTGVTFAKMDLLSDGNIVRYNIINNNTERGFNMNNRYIANFINYFTNPFKVTITKNSFYNNGQLGIDLRMGDITTPAASAGPVNANDSADLDVGANTNLNFPLIIYSGTDGASNVIVSGCGPAGATVEIYVSDNNTAYLPLYATSPIPIPTGFTGPLGINGYGEGRRFVYSFVEGSSADLAAGNYTYNDDGTGVLGSRTEAAWQVSIPLASFPPGFDLTWKLTSTATDSSGNTSEFGPSPVLILLPLPNQEFSAYQQQQGVKISLNMANSIPVRKTVFQWSVNGTDWTDIKEFWDFGQTGQCNYTHVNPARGNNYYRAKTFQNDGRINYTLVKLVKMGGHGIEQAFSVYPNPSDGRFTLTLPASISNKEMTLKIADMNGRLLINQQAVYRNSDEVNVTLARGNYILSLTEKNTGKTFSKKIQIQ